MYKVGDMILTKIKIWDMPAGTSMRILELGYWGGYTVRAVCEDWRGDVLLATHEFVVVEDPTEEALQELV